MEKMERHLKWALKRAKEGCKSSMEYHLDLAREQAAKASITTDFFNRQASNVRKHLQDEGGNPRREMEAYLKCALK